MDIAIQIQNLTKKYNNFYALDNLDLEVNQGEVLGYLGPNGAGKTTTIRLMLGLAKPTNGSSHIFGIDSQKNKIEAHKYLAYVPGETNIWPHLTGAEALHLLGQVQGGVNEGYKKVLIKRFDFDVNKKIRSYSKGNRQKLSLIAGLMNRAKLLILDEPTSGLDPLMEQSFRLSIEEAKANKQTIFLSSHILSEVEALCDRVAILRGGKLVEVGTLQSMRHLTSMSVSATFSGAIPKIDHIKGVKNVTVSGQQLTCQVHGPIGELLNIISSYNPIAFTCKEPSLEEIFLSHYGNN